MSKKFTLELNARQVLALFEMCETCSSLIHAKHRESGKLPESFALVMSIQGKLDGCEEMFRLDDCDEVTCEPSKATMLDLAEVEGLRGNTEKWVLPELQKDWSACAEEPEVVLSKEQNDRVAKWLEATS